MSYPIFSIKNIAEIARQRQANRFDAIIGIFGKRGLGKSTLALQLCKKIGRYRIEHLDKIYKAGNFRMKRDMVYDRISMIHLLKDRKFRICFGDEMINAAYNREFSSTDQQALLKILNQYRSNYNIFVMCNPFFYDLDNDLRNLVTIRIDVIRRGMALVHTQNDALYQNDGWDSKYNQAIEKSWITKGITKPKYTHLSTFRGLLLFHPLKPELEKEYERIRDMKRNMVNADADTSIPVDLTTQKEALSRIFDLMNKGEVTRESLDPIMKMYNLNITQVKRAINTRLKNDKRTERFDTLINNAKPTIKYSKGGKILKENIDELGYRL